MSKIAEHIKNNMQEEIEDMEKNVQGLEMMIGMAEDWNYKRTLLTQIFNLNEEIKQRKGQK